MISKFIKREISDFAFSEEWLGDTMLFIAGPRQCGKTFLARQFLKKKDCTSLYYNWDVESVRRRYRKNPDFIAREALKTALPAPTVVIDEIHKTTRWKNILKGIYDEYRDAFRIIVTGSARLDLFRRSGDSLVGRHTLVRLFPFSLREWTGRGDQTSSVWLHSDGDWQNPVDSFESKLNSSCSVEPDVAESYFKFGPFPVPLISGSERRSRKWHRDYLTLLVKEDLRDISGIRELDRVAHLVELLPERIGSPLSFRSLAGDLEANHSTIKNWLQALEKLYLVWPLRPYSAKLNRTLRKDAKWYFLDWTYASTQGGRFENMIATTLYRFVTSLNDRGWPTVKLFFMRTYDKKEIDFILTVDNNPILAIEARTGDINLSPALERFRDLTKQDFPILQVVNHPGVFVPKGNRAYLVGYDRLMMML